MSIFDYNYYNDIVIKSIDRIEFDQFLLLIDSGIYDNDLHKYYKHCLINFHNNNTIYKDCQQQNTSDFSTVNERLALHYKKCLDYIEKKINIRNTLYLSFKTNLIEKRTFICYNIAKFFSNKDLI